MGQIGRFVADREHRERGEAVVIETRRGLELGRVVSNTPVEVPESWTPKVVRSAQADDLSTATVASSIRNDWFEKCRRVFEDGIWPIEAIDVEPLLEPGRAVLYYLGPHQLEVDGLREALRQSCGLDLVFEPIGKDFNDQIDDESHDHADDDHGCGSGGCGTGGGCGSEGGGGCGTSSSSGSGCSTCTVSSLVANRRRPTVPQS
jgi:uncharacterized membrane protein YgcG